jgi:hypothetical protein
MADPVWPDTLPAPLVGSDYNYKGVDPFSRTNMDGGIARQRRRFQSTPTNIAATWLFTTAQLATFESFVKNEINAGTSWFVVPLINGQGKNPVRARFTETHQVNGTDKPTLFQVQAKLETLSMPVAS